MLFRYFDTFIGYISLVPRINFTEHLFSVMHVFQTDQLIFPASMLDLLADLFETRS